MPLVSWAIRKSITTVITWFTAISISIIIIVLTPGDPSILLLSSFLQRGVPYNQAVEMVRAYIGFSPEEPWWNKWMRYIQGVVMGNLGTSITYQLSVSRLIAGALPWSLFFVSYSLSIIIVIGVLIGLALSYYRHKTLFAKTTTTILTILNSIPNWILAAIFFVYIGARWQLLPYTGPHSPNVQPGLSLQFISSVLHHYTLPMLVMVLTSIPSWAFGISAMASTIHREDFVLVAKARGLPSRRILVAYIAKNSILPIYANIGVTFAWLLVGTVWIESQFLLPGLGSLLTITIGSRDYPVIIGTYTIVITAIILGALFTDLTYGLIDPRARVEES